MRRGECEGRNGATHPGLLRQCAFGGGAPWLASPTAAPARRQPSVAARAKPITLTDPCSRRIHGIVRYGNVVQSSEPVKNRTAYSAARSIPSTSDVPATAHSTRGSGGPDRAD